MKLLQLKFIKIMRFSKKRSKNETRDFNELTFILSSTFYTFVHIEGEPGVCILIIWMGLHIP